MKLTTRMQALVAKSRESAEGKQHAPLTKEAFGKLLSDVGDWDKGMPRRSEARTKGARWLSKAPWLAGKFSDHTKARLTRAVARAFLFACPTADMFQLCLKLCSDGKTEMIPGSLIFAVGVPRVFPHYTWATYAVRVSECVVALNLRQAYQFVAYYGGVTPEVLQLFLQYSDLGARILDALQNRPENSTGRGAGAQREPQDALQYVAWLNTKWAAEGSVSAFVGISRDSLPSTSVPPVADGVEIAERPNWQLRWDRKDLLETEIRLALFRLGTLLDRAQILKHTDRASASDKTGAKLLGGFLEGSVPDRGDVVVDDVQDAGPVTLAYLLGREPKVQVVTQTMSGEVVEPWAIELQVDDLAGGTIYFANDVDPLSVIRIRK